MFCFRFLRFRLLFSKHAKAVLKADCVGRAGTYTLSASDTFGAVRCFCNINIHFAHLCTFTARNAFVLVYLHLKQRNLVEQCIKCTEWANPFAERSVKQHAQNDYRNQHNKFPRKQFPNAERIPSLTAESGNAPSSTPCGHIYLQKYGSPIPKSFTMSTGNKTTANSSTAYLIYVSGLSFLLKTFWSGLCATNPVTNQTDTKIRR